MLVFRSPRRCSSETNKFENKNDESSYSIKFTRFGVTVIYPNFLSHSVNFCFIFHVLL